MMSITKQNPQAAAKVNQLKHIKQVQNNKLNNTSEQNQNMLTPQNSP